MQTRVYDRLYYVDATFDHGDRTLRLEFQTEEGALLNTPERTILTNAVNSIATGEVERTTNDPKQTLKFTVAGVKDVDEAALFVRKVAHNANGRFLDNNINLTVNPKEATVVTPVTD